MLEQIVNYIGSVGLKHKAVKTFKYQKRSLINQQNNNGYVELIIEDNAYLQQVITQNIFTATFNVDILGFPKDDTDIGYPVTMYADSRGDNGIYRKRRNILRETLNT